MAAAGELLACHQADDDGEHEKRESREDAFHKKLYTQSWIFRGREEMSFLFDGGAMLFDLDGLLVDTEQLHWKAYRGMCEQFGCTLDWDFPLYLEVGSNNPDGIEIKESKDPWGHPVDGIPFHPYYTVKEAEGFPLLH